MKGLTEKGVRSIENLIKQQFDSFSLRILGLIPTQTKDKNIVFKTTRNSIVSLFLQSLQSREPNRLEERSLKTMLRIASNYLDALKERTSARVVQDVDAYMKNQSLKKQPISMKKIHEIVNKEMQKAGKHLKLIANAESQKAVNTGTALKISKIAEEKGEEDPNVFFVVTVDDVTGSEEFVLHLLPDRKTPRVWKLSEIGSEYHKKGDPNPKLPGLHPNCFTENQLLFTKNGLFTFKELYETQVQPTILVDYRVRNRKKPSNQFGIEIPGDTWLHPHSKEQNRFLKSTKVYDTGMQEVLRITLNSGHQKEVTLDHECWVEIGNTKWSKVKAKFLKIGDKVPLNNNDQCFGDDHFPEMAELMGNLLGDGVFNEKTGWCVWNFFGNDIEYGYKLIEKRNKLTDSKYKNGRTVKAKSKQDSKKYNESHMQMSSRYLGKIFQKEFGLSKKPRRVPKRLFQATQDTVYGFLRGLYAADGHSEKNSIVLAQNDYEFLRQVQLLLSMCGFVSSIYEHGKEVVKDITYSNGDIHQTIRKPCWRLAIGGANQYKKFIENIGFGVPKKQEKAIKNYAPHNTHINNWMTSRIVKIENIGIQQTYCLTEPIANTVTVNGIVTGQCRCKLTYLAKGFGFDESGRVKYIDKDHDEFTVQREKYGLPR